jgi:hypothetical protein
VDELTTALGAEDFAAGIVALADAGSKIIVDDVIYFAEPMFLDGPIAQAADRVKSRGVAYFRRRAIRPGSPTNPHSAGPEAKAPAAACCTISPRARLSTICKASLRRRAALRCCRSNGISRGSQ